MRDGRVVTIPNVISVVRLACIPLFCWLLFGADDPVGAFLLLTFLGCTDWVDGYIARHFDQGSELGKILDPTADRLLLLVAVVALLIDGSVPVVVGILVLVREAVVGGATLLLALAGARRIDVLWVGKAGTLAIMVAFPSLLLAHHTYATWHVIAMVVGWGFMIPGLILSYYAAFNYVPLARRALREGTAGAPDHQGPDYQGPNQQGKVSV
jgi:cardiolipin synthase (CMP-forming)